MCTACELVGCLTVRSVRNRKFHDKRLRETLDRHVQMPSTSLVVNLSGYGLPSVDPVPPHPVTRGVVLVLLYPRVVSGIYLVVPRSKPLVHLAGRKYSVLKAPTINDNGYRCTRWQSCRLESKCSQLDYVLDLLLADLAVLDVEPYG